MLANLKLQISIFNEDNPQVKMAEVLSLLADRVNRGEGTIFDANGEPCGIWRT